LFQLPLSQAPGHAYTFAKTPRGFSERRIIYTDSGAVRSYLRKPNPVNSETYSADTIPDKMCCKIDWLQENHHVNVLEQSRKIRRSNTIRNILGRLPKIQIQGACSMTLLSRRHFLKAGLETAGAACASQVPLPAAARPTDQEELATLIDSRKCVGY